MCVNVYICGYICAYLYIYIYIRLDRFGSKPEGGARQPSPRPSETYQKPIGKSTFWNLPGRYRFGVYIYIYIYTPFEVTPLRPGGSEASETYQKPIGKSTVWRREGWREEDLEKSVIYMCIYTYGAEEEGSEGGIEKSVILYIFPLRPLPPLRTWLTPNAHTPFRKVDFPIGF